MSHQNVNFIEVNVLAERLLVLGYEVEVPMEGLGIGEQLAWMDRAAAAVRG